VPIPPIADDPGLLTLSAVPRNRAATVVNRDDFSIAFPLPAREAIVSVDVTLRRVSDDHADEFRECADPDGRRGVGREVVEKVASDREQHGRTPSMWNIGYPSLDAASN